MLEFWIVEVWLGHILGRGGPCDQLHGPPWPLHLRELPVLGDTSPSRNPQLAPIGLGLGFPQPAHHCDRVRPGDAGAEQGAQEDSLEERTLYSERQEHPPGKRAGSL